MLLCWYSKRMEIYIGTDHRGFRMKNDLLLWFHNHGYEVTDVGNHADNPEDNYPEYAKLVADAVAKQRISLLKQIDKLPQQYSESFKLMTTLLGNVARIVLDEE